MSTTEFLLWASGSQFKVVRLSEVNMGHYMSQRRASPKETSPETILPDK